jgi:hypothetical protein
MDVRNLQDQAYFESLCLDIDKEIKKAEEKIKEEERIKLEKENADPPKPTLDELRELRLRAFMKKSL